MDFLERCFDFQKCINDRRIEMSAGFFDDDSAGDIVGDCGFVNAAAGQGVVDVGEGRDSATQGNIAAFEAIRVAGAVEPLVVGSGNVAGDSQKRRVGESK